MWLFWLYTILPSTLCCPSSLLSSFSSSWSPSSSMWGTRTLRTLANEDFGTVAENDPLTGKGGWIMNLLPKARWTIQRCWGAIAEEERRLSSFVAGMARRRTRGGTRNHLIARRQVGVSLRWIVAFWGGQELSFSRVFGATRPPADFELIFDASPWGLGGVLATASSSEALQFFHEPLTTNDCTRFKVDLGDAKGQQYWEALSVLVDCEQHTSHVTFSRWFTTLLLSHWHWLKFKVLRARHRMCHPHGVVVVLIHFHFTFLTIFPIFHLIPLVFTFPCGPVRA